VCDDCFVHDYYVLCICICASEATVNTSRGRVETKHIWTSKFSSFQQRVEGQHDQTERAQTNREQCLFDELSVGVGAASTAVAVANVLQRTHQKTEHTKTIIQNNCTNGFPKYSETILRHSRTKSPCYLFCLHSSSVSPSPLPSPTQIPLLARFSRVTHHSSPSRLVFHSCMLLNFLDNLYNIFICKHMFFSHNLRIMLD